MKARIQNQIDKTLAALLFSLPQGILFSVILLAYGTWIQLNLRSFRIPFVLSAHAKSAL
jgi:hypothetical protein